MKVCILTSSYHPYYKGGGEYSVKQLAEGLAKSGINVFVIAAYKEDQDLSIIDGVRVYRVKSPNIYWSGDSGSKNNIQKAIWHIKEGYSYRTHKTIKDIFLKEEPDIVHTRNVSDFPPYIWKFCRKQSIPTVLTLNSYASICINANLFSDNKVCESRCSACKAVSYPKKVLSKYVDAVVGVSEFTLNEHLKYGLFKNARKYVIRTQAPFLNHKKEAVSTDTTFGFIGQINPNKGLLELINTFKATSKGNVKLLIGGDKKGTYYQACLKAANNDSRIEFLGRVNASDFYQQLDVVIIPSVWYEPFPRVLVEAYSYGLPVITTGKGGIKEMVIEGKTGFLYESSNQLKDIISTISAGDVDFSYFKNNIMELLASDRKNDIEKYISVYQDLLSDNSI